MIIIEEKPSKKLPNLTSLYFKLNTLNKTIIDSLNQQTLVHFDKKTNIYELPITRLFYVVKLLIGLEDIKFIPYKEKKKELIDCNNFKFKVKPYSYQLDGINYGLNHDGWLLLDDQGLGKTLQMIYLAEVLHKTEGLEHCFIICGVNGLKYNWANEISKFSKLSYTILGLKTKKNGKEYICSVPERCKILEKPIKEFFVITNIETLQNAKFAESFNKGKNKFDMIVLDEAHRCKNPSSKATKNLLKLKSKRNIALTGTIIMNNPENAYVPLKWTNNLSCTFSKFNSMYNIYGGFGGVQVIGYKNLELLREHLSSCSLRRLKSEVLDLPERNFSIEYVELLPQQRALYDEVAAGIAAELDLLPNKRMTIIEEITMNLRLRQITAWPGILSSEVTQSAKLDRLEQLLENVTEQGDKAIVFCTFKPTVTELLRRLEKYNPIACTGDLSDAEINRNKEIFNNDASVKVMICTWQKMGTGHTLIAANYAIFIDTPWTDADFQQTCDRIYRIGQNKKVFITTLIAKHTYDERVQEILDRKEMLSDYVVNKVDNEIIQTIDYEGY